jgi:hypothetical protein
LFITLTTSIALINTQRQVKTLTQELSFLKKEIREMKEGEK